MSAICPCGSMSLYESCCGPFHQKTHYPETAQSLMRSRYSAYVLKQIDYLVDTTHPSQRTPHMKDEISRWANSVEAWMGLTIMSEFQGQSADKIGKVEFMATYELSSEAKTLHERSRFKRFEGHWTYLDGELFET